MDIKTYTLQSNEKLLHKISWKYNNHNGFTAYGNSKNGGGIFEVGGSHENNSILEGVDQKKHDEILWYNGLLIVQSIAEDSKVQSRPCNVCTPRDWPIKF